MDRNRVIPLALTPATKHDGTSGKANAEAVMFEPRHVP